MFRCFLNSELVMVPCSPTKSDIISCVYHSKIQGITIKLFVKRSRWQQMSDTMQ